jgi:hypothetical protein
MSALDFENAIQSEDLKSVARYWNLLRGNRKMPGWHDIKPKFIAKQLPMVWAYRYEHGTDEFIGRLAGDRIVRLLGKSFRGITMREAYPQHDYPSIFSKSMRVVGGPALHRSWGVLFRGTEKANASSCHWRVTGRKVMASLVPRNMGSTTYDFARQWHRAETRNSGLSCSPCWPRTIGAA